MILAGAAVPAILREQERDPAGTVRLDPVPGRGLRVAGEALPLPPISQPRPISRRPALFPPGGVAYAAHADGGGFGEEVVGGSGYCYFAGGQDREEGGGGGCGLGGGLVRGCCQAGADAVGVGDEERLAEVAGAAGAAVAVVGVACAVHGGGGLEEQ
uniref:hypothetical protein n=1 Tax=Streptomyces rimosus TaxID=1927 RepID=UPI001F33FA51|nr:hypothetical protein [Streptomyces rimosus]